MASWYVENLIRGSVLIREKINNSSGEALEINLESEAYMDLLSVEKVLSELYAKNLVEAFDRRIVTLMSTGLSVEKAAEILHVARPTISKRFSAVCGRVTFMLGDTFSNEGYVDSMKEKYKLTNDQVIKALEYMKSSTKRILINSR